MLPAFDSGQDAAWIGGPGEGFRIAVCLGNEAVDGVLEIVDGSEDTALEAPARELGKEAFDGVEPDAEVGVKWKVQRGCWASRARTLGCLWVA